MLVDIVSKNGNLLLNIPLPGHGEPDADELAILGELADWQQVNSEAIKGTRPWTVYGEGPSTRRGQVKSYQLAQIQYGPADIRFTVKGEALYAIALGWPENGKLLVTSLAEGSLNYPRQIGRIELLGAKSPVRWTRGQGGLEIQLPESAPCKYAFAFRILPA